MKSFYLKILFSVGTLCLLATTDTFAGSFDSAGREGVAHHNANEYKNAVDKFQEAQGNQPENPEVAYNLGNARYQLGQYEAAVEDYTSVIAQTPDARLKQQAFYNQGNAYYRLGYLEEAIDAYKKALEIDPSDEDSKFNLEYAQKKLEKALASGQMAPRNMKEQSSSKGQSKPNSSEEGTEQTADQESGQAGEPKEPEPDLDQLDEPGEEAADQLASHKPTAPQKPESPKSEDREMRSLLHEMTPMTREEAERWLNSLSEDVKKYKKRQMQGEMKDLFNEQKKDW